MWAVPSFLWSFSAVGAAAVIGILGHFALMRNAAYAAGLEGQLSEERRRHAAALEKATSDLTAVQRQLKEHCTQGGRQKSTFKEVSNEPPAAVLLLEAKLSEQQQRHEAALENAAANAAALQRQLEEQQTSAKEKLREQQAAILLLESKLSDQQRLHEAAQAAANEQAAANAAELQLQLEEQRADALRQQASAEERLPDQRAAVLLLESKLSDQRRLHEAALEHAKSNAAALQRQLEEQQTAAEERLREQRAAVARLEAQLEDERRRHAAALEQVSADLVTAQQLLQEQRADGQQQLEATEGDAQEQRDTILRLEAQLAVQQEQAAVSLASAKGQLAAAQQQNATMEKQLHEQSITIARVEARLAAVAEDLAQERANHNSTVVELLEVKSKLLHAEKVVKEKADEVSTLEGQLSKVKAQARGAAAEAAAAAEVEAQQLKGSLQVAEARVAVLESGQQAVPLSPGPQQQPPDAQAWHQEHQAQEQRQNEVTVLRRGGRKRADAAAASAVAEEGLAAEGAPGPSYEREGPKDGADVDADEDGGPSADGEEAGYTVQALKQQLQEALDQASALRQQNDALTGQLGVANELLARMNHLTQALQSIRRRSQQSGDTQDVLAM